MNTVNVVSRVISLSDGLITKIKQNKLIAAIITVIVILIISSIIKIHYDRHKRKKAYKSYNKSNGLNDKNSKEAKKIINDIEHKTSKDEFLSTRINQLNENSAEPKVIEGYKNTLEKLITEPATENTEQNRQENIPNREFITDAITNFLINVEEKQQQRATRVLEHLDGNPNENANNNGRNVRVEQVANGRVGQNLNGQNRNGQIVNGQIVNGQIANGQIIQNANPFMIDDFMENLELTAILPMGYNNFIPMDTHIIDFIDYAEFALPIARTQTIQERKKEAKANSKNKKEEIKNYFTASIDHTNDPQNAHDVHVNKDIAATYNLLSENERDFATTRREIADYISRSSLSPNVKDKAMTTLERINSANRLIMVLGDGANEQKVLSRVWGRTYANGNEGNSQLMKENIILALSDAVENGSVVCANGVCSRLLSSLIFLDKNKDVGKINTYEEIKNTIYEKSKKLIDNEIEIISKSPDVVKANVGKSFKDVKIVPDEAAMTMFNNELGRKLDLLVYEEAKEHKLEQYQIEQIKDYVKSAIN